MTKAQLPDAPYLVLPKRLGWQLLAALVSLIITAAVGATVVKHDINTLQEKSDGNRFDINRLLVERDEVIRMREKLTTQGEILKEIRDELRRR